MPWKILRDSLFKLDVGEDMFKIPLQYQISDRIEMSPEKIPRGSQLIWAFVCVSESDGFSWLGLLSQVRPKPWNILMKRNYCSRGHQYYRSLRQWSLNEWSSVPFVSVTLYPFQLVTKCAWPWSFLLNLCPIFLRYWKRKLAYFMIFCLFFFMPYSDTMAKFATKLFHFKLVTSFFFRLPTNQLCFC
jgi:hypothetical protein